MGRVRGEKSRNFELEMFGYLGVGIGLLFMFFGYRLFAQARGTEAGTTAVMSIVNGFAETGMVGTWPEIVLMGLGVVIVLAALFSGRGRRQEKSASKTDGLISRAGK